MTEMSPLRRRMIEDMTVRNLSPATQRSYVHAVAKFGRFFGRSPEMMKVEKAEHSLGKGEVAHAAEATSLTRRGHRFRVLACTLFQPSGHALSFSRSSPSFGEDRLNGGIHGPLGGWLLRIEQGVDLQPIVARLARAKESRRLREFPRLKQPG
jgi:hypothetical protein